VNEMPALAEAFATQSTWCAQAGAPLYAELLRGMAHNLAQGGIVAALCSGYEDAPASAVLHIRLLAGLHEIVLAGHAPELEPYYPSVGGQGDRAGVWPVAQSVLTEHADRVRAWLDVVPQTNEVGRSVGLAVGLVTAVAMTGRRRVRLLQPGASAGLHLLVDDYWIEGQGWAWGPSWSPVRMPGAVTGTLPMMPAGVIDDLSRVVNIVERRGCDVAPVDVRTAAGRRRLQAFIWPEAQVRHERLAEALEIAQADPPVVDRADAADWLEQQLSRPADDDVVTVVWSSITLQYLDKGARQRISALIARARDRMPVVQVGLESSGSHYLAPPQLALDGRPIGSSPPHGLPLTLGPVGTLGR